MSREMVGGCSVCSDELGWPENPLVYCDGPNCNVAVHQGGYSVITRWSRVYSPAKRSPLFIIVPSFTTLTHSTLVA